MPRRRADGVRPDWPALLALAAQQGGHFTLRQAIELGYSRQLVDYRFRTGTLERDRRGIYRLAHYPRDEQDELVLDWLWSEREGVFSHDTALALHALSDILPKRRHLSVPAGWDPSQIRTPRGLVLHPGLPPRDAIQWKGIVPITRPLRTLEDCAASGVAPDLLEQAVREGVAAGVFSTRAARGALARGREAAA